MPADNTSDSHLKEIRLVVVAGVDLLKWNVFRSPDAFAVIKVNNRRVHQTSVIKMTRNPYWDEPSNIRVNESSVVTIDVFDQFMLSSRRALLTSTSFRIGDVLDLKQDDCVTHSTFGDNIYNNYHGAQGLVIHLCADTNKPPRRPDWPETAGGLSSSARLLLKEETDAANAIYSYNLAVNFLKHYYQENQLRNINLAVARFRDAFTWLPAGHKHRWLFLNNLAHSLHARFEKMHEIEDLDEAIELLRGALQLQPEDRPTLLIYLATVFFKRFECSSQLVDLDEAVELAREVLASQPPDHPQRSTSIHILVHSLMTRFQKTCQPIDQDECVALQQVLYDLPSRPVEPPRKYGSYEHPVFGAPTNLIFNPTTALSLIYAANDNTRQAAQKLKQVFTRRRFRTFTSGHPSPIRRLPPELLSQVFTTCLDICGSWDNINKAAFRLSGVCRHWRSVAFTTPLLWYRFTITFRSTDVQSQVEVVTAWLARAGVLPLTLRLRCLQDTDSHPIVDTIMQYAPRIQVLHLNLTPWSVQMIGPLKGCLPLLQNLRVMIQFARDIPFQLDTFSHAPNLHDLAMTYHPRNWDLPWEQIRRFHGMSFHFSDCVDILRRCTNISGCVFSRCHSNGTLTDKVVSNLRSFILVEAISSIEDLIKSITLPAVREIFIQSNPSHTTPQMQLLPFFCRSSQNLETLVLRAVRMSGDDFIACLRAVPFLRVLEVGQPVDLPATITNLVLQQLMSSSDVLVHSLEFPLVPNLHTIKFSGNFDLNGRIFLNMIRSRWNSALLPPNGCSSLRCVRLRMHRPLAPDDLMPLDQLRTQLDELPMQGLDFLIELFPADKEVPYYEFHSVCKIRDSFD